MTTLEQNTRALTSFLAANHKLLILTGAGISCASGIPTYRDQYGNWLHSKPIQEQDFLRDPLTQKRYWARSWYGWPIIRSAVPNPAHTALATLEQQGRIELLITQNVDGLHQSAGSTRVIDLHGRVDRVRCLHCSALYERDYVQSLLARDNDWPRPPHATPRPDGDMEIEDDWIFQLTLPRCQACAGALMPDVVFFGGSVPAATIQTCHAALEVADAVLVVGSSLTVFSGFRFCRWAHQLGKPLAIINPGVTRGDTLAQLKLTSLAAPLLAQLLERINTSKFAISIHR